MELILNGRFLCQRATGVQRVSREFVLALDRLLRRGEFAGFTVRLVVPRGTDCTSLELMNIPVEHLGGGTGYFWEQVALPLRARNAMLLCLGNTGPVLGLVSGRVGVMLHDQAHRYFPADYSWAYRLAHTLIEYFVLRLAHPLITVSQTEAETLRRSNDVPLRHLLVAPNGCWLRDLATPKPRHAKSDGESFVLYVGGFSKRKNFAGVVEAARILADRGILVRLVGQPNELCSRFLESLDERQRSRIDFCGYVDDTTLAQLYRDAICLMYPSFYEASGLPPTEAMHFGCPVVVSDLPVLRERCGHAALYCDPSAPGQIAARVLEIIDDPLLAMSLSKSALECSKQFTWENQARLIVCAALEAHNDNQYSAVPQVRAIPSNIGQAIIAPINRPYRILVD